MRHGTTLRYMLLAVALAGCARDRADRGGDDGAAVTPPAAPATSPPLSVTGTDWVLTRLGAEPALPANARARPWFRLDPSDRRRVTGSGGVNVISGSYELSGGALQFGELVTTRRAGAPELMRQEAAFLDALQRTATAELRGRSLTLRDAARAPLAEFEAMNLTP